MQENMKEDARKKFSAYIYAFFNLHILETRTSNDIFSSTSYYFVVFFFIWLQRLILF